MTNEQDVFHAFNEYLEAAELPRLRKMYHDIFNPPYYFYSDRSQALNVYENKLKSSLLQAIQEKAGLKKPERLYDNTLRKYGHISGLIRLINYYLDEWLYILSTKEIKDWDDNPYMRKGKTASAEYFCNMYYITELQNHLPKQIKSLFGKHLENYSFKDFGKYFKDKLEEPLQENLRGLIQRTLNENFKGTSRNMQ